MKAQQLPIVIVAGFLGAGKTTLMRHLIGDAQARGIKVGVIINEFGVADIDSTILREGGAELLSGISGGCACCSNQQELLDALMDVADRFQDADDPRRPDVVLLETSGLADPVALLDCLTISYLLPKITVASLITVVDSCRVGEMLDNGKVSKLLCRQAQLADLIVLNKTDIAFRHPSRGRWVQQNVELLRELNRHAHLEATKGARIDTEVLWSRVRHVTRPVELSSQNAKHNQGSPHAHHQTLTMPLHGAIERARLEDALKSLGPEVWRVKGFLRLRDEDGLFLLQYAVNSNGGSWEILPFHLSDLHTLPPTELVFIGPHLHREKLFRDFASAALLMMA